MADSIDLYLDMSTPQGGLFPSLNSLTPVVLGPFYQGQLLSLRVYPVKRISGAAIAPFLAKLPITTLDLQVVVGPAAGAEAIKAAQYTWTKQTVNDSDGASGYFYADLDLNTTDMNTAVGSAESFPTKIEFLISRASGGFTAAHQADIVVKSVVKTPGSAASIPTPAASYLTRDECYALFVMWDNRVRAANAGRAPILVSPDGSHTREIGVDNDGSPTDNLT